jgi:NAD+ synthase (glutamine-hydrolysing)
VNIGFAQLNTTVGDLRGNAEQILAAYRYLVDRGAQLVLTPELALTGYPPQDLVFKSRFVPLNLEALEELHRSVGDVPLVVGFIDINTGAGRPFHNAAAVLQRGQPVRKAYKSLLPTYDVFDEDRYFEPAKSVAPIEIAGMKFGVTICEDIWTERYLPRRLYGCAPVQALVAQGATAILNLSASPFALGKAARRAEMLSAVAREHRIAIHYCNATGGNDQLIFDGNSLAFDATGALHTKLAPFTAESAIVELSPAAASTSPTFQSEPEELFHALSLGTRDYLHKCGFRSAVLGLSGGIDSAVTACIAAHALGADQVLGVTMPTQYSSQGSIDDSLIIAKNLGIRCHTIPIQRSFEVFREQFREIFAGLPEDTAEENMQPRLRGMTLMALSNKFGSLLLTTGNKSELAVGYCTLYGDMCGGLAVISDVPKTMVYRLAEWINRDREIIPRATIEKPPSAELKPDQRDQDTLPPYEILDPILQLYVEEQLSGAEIIARGFDEKTVRWVVRRVDLNEYKRAQAVPGLKVTSRAFGLGRRMPVAQRFVE